MWRSDNVLVFLIYSLIHCSMCALGRRSDFPLRFKLKECILPPVTQKLHRRSKPDQIEERGSVSSAQSVPGAHVAAEQHAECLFLLVLVCPLVILAIFSRWHNDELALQRKTSHPNPIVGIIELLLILMKAELKSREFKFNSLVQPHQGGDSGFSPIYS